MKKKLKNIANRLLDLGKRNRLLNFKDTGLRALSVLNRDVETIFKGLTDSKVYSVFMVDSVLQKYHKDLILRPEEDNPMAYSDAKVYDIASGLLKQNQLLCYKRGYSLEQVLKSLLKEYKYSITEKGINSLYFAFGFIRYAEDKELYRAPLLLIPIELSVEKGIYKVREYEDEVILNPTLKYYFKTERKILLPEYEDEEPEVYFSKVEQVLDKDMELLRGCAVGIFSFLKMNMYNDLTANADTVLENANIRALLGDDTALTENLREYPVCPVVDCDSSQLEAIGFAANGKSFCLQGPPGSGKSQTITNMISTLLAEGKHILFVSEKLAALQVVYDNLKSAGLEDFAIELHSSKANKKEFIDNLYKTAQLPKYDIDVKAEYVSSKHSHVKQSLKEYDREIHKWLEPYHGSLYDLLSMYMSLDIEPASFRLHHTEEDTLEKLDIICEAFGRYAHYAEGLGYDYRTMPFYGIRQLPNDYIRYEMEEELKRAILYITKFDEFKDILRQKLQINISTIPEVYESLDLLETMVHLKTVHSAYFIKEEREKLTRQLELYLSLKPKLKEGPLKLYRESVLKEDLEDLYVRFKANCQRMFKAFHSEYRKLYHKIIAYRKEKAKAGALLQELSELVEYKKNLIAAKKALVQIKKILPEEESKNFEAVLSDLNSLKGIKDISLSKDEYLRIKPSLTDILISFQASKDNTILDIISVRFDFTLFDFYKEPISTVLSKLKGIYLKKDKLADYLLLNQSIEEIREYRQEEYLNAYLERGLELKNISKQFRKLFLQTVIYTQIEKTPVLKSFTSYSLDKISEEFVRLDEQILRLNRDTVISVNSKKRPDDVLLEGSEYRILSSEANKLKRQKPIRILLEDIFELALDIKPVFLMSPLSVSTYLSNKVNLFDCVIFDEASQIFAWDALGAIYRAKQCIIIGDTKQMPPSDFFNASMEDAEEDTLELESILDVASLCFLTSRLKWHYRSRSEELIVFSNREFYDYSLITIPQAKKHERGFGIDFYYLPEGRYDAKTRTNPIEAERICDMVFEHFGSSSQSLGVVAFSDVQARLIESMIEKKVTEQPEYADYFNENKEEPFFVKNLESVQGDERDRIIFSICYGYNRDNKFYQRFGPLNNLGGERRLNVAITRAKYNISVVSSIRYTDIRLENTDSLGVKMLKGYLEFIEEIENKRVYSQTENGTALSIKKYIEDLGYTCYTDYGSSIFKIDLAVMKNDEFILAVMLDKKKGYRVNTTDKERLERLLLERLGWRYLKIYSAAWFLHPEIEKERLKRLLTENTSRNLKKTEDNFLQEDTSVQELSDRFIPYSSLNIEKAKRHLEEYGLAYVVRELIRTEQPIHEEFMYKRLSEITESRITNVFKKTVRQSIDDDAILRGRFYSLNEEAPTRLRIGSERLIEYISSEELKDGILTIVRLNNGITVDGCYKALISLLGYSRITENTRNCLDDAVVFLKLDGSITQRGDSLFV